jgi:hypothetical protein
MQVFCVNKENIWLTLDGVEVPGPRYGDIDTVIGEIDGTGKYEGYKGYLLERFGENLPYLTSKFIPISEVEAPILEEELCEC